MKLSHIAIKRPVTTIMMVLLVILLGIIGFQRTNIDLFPDLTYPGAAVITNYSGVGPREVENMVTKPIESSLATVTNIKNLTSTSSKGQSVVVAEFNWGTDMDSASMDMRESLDLMGGALPDEAEDPFVVKFDPSMMPIMRIGVIGENDLASLKKLIEDRISPRLERREGVAAVNLVGGLEREIQVIVDQTKLSSYSLNLATIISTLRTENLDLTGGSVTRGEKDILVRVTGKFNSLSEIKNILIPAGAETVPLENIARVEDTFKEVRSKARLNGKPSIGLTIQKQTDANTVAVSERIKEEMSQIEKDLNGIKMTPVIDQSEFIQESISRVGQNAFYGGILAILVLLIFLHNIRSTIIVGTAIPVSIIATFLLIYFGGLTLNMMSLGGLALGIGMLVDNSIVVLENIYRYRLQGAGKIESARKGSTEVGMAIVASTITTAVVFLPVVFVEGMASQLFEELALTVTFSLLASLVVSLTLIPVMSSKILKIKSEKRHHILEHVKNYYRESLNWSLNHRWLIILILILALAGSFSLYPQIGSEFIPQMDQGQIQIEAKLPSGTHLEKTNSISLKIEEIVSQIPEVNSILTNIGSSSMMQIGGGGSSGSDIANFLIKLVPSTQRDRTTSEVIEEIRSKINIPDVTIDVSSMDMVGGGMGGGKPVNIKVKGDSLETLSQITSRIKKEISGIQGIREVEDSFSEGRPELQIKINRTLAAKQGLRVGQIGSTIEAAISGKVATRYEVEGEEYDIRVKLKEKDIDTPAQVRNLMLVSNRGNKVPLENIASFKMEEGPRTIEREDQVRYATVSAALFNTNLGTAMEKVQQRLDQNLTMPPGYEIEYGGQYQEMTASFQDLFFAFILAVILVYMVMASQFESLLHPFVIMFTVPMAIIGVLLGLYITGHNISVVSIIGIVMLAGIVVNNAIVLVDYINTVRERGKNVKEAILEAGPIRLRPILMTAFTTILALLPIALGIGEGAEIQAPMGVVVIGGLSIATFLTLYVIPVLYSISAGITRKIR
uniref:Cation/multidrug efflux pump n=1 Tax=uncultured organism TaxID=155900 RepID=M1P1W9_9ZZZZ|nr:cation/multidrug efflux pump [uncultured organism]